MRKWFLMLMVVVASVLVACSGDDNKDEST